MTTTEKPKNWKEPVMKRVCHPNGSVTIYLLADCWDRAYGYMRMTSSWAIVKHKGDAVRRVPQQKVAPIVTINSAQDLARDCPHCGVGPGERCIAVNIAVIHTERRTRVPLPKPEAKPQVIPLPRKRVEQPGPREEKTVEKEPEEKTEPQNEAPIRDTEPAPSKDEDTFIDGFEGEPSEESVLGKWARMAREAEERDDN